MKDDWLICDTETYPGKSAVAVGYQGSSQTLPVMEGTNTNRTNQVSSIKHSYLTRGTISHRLFQLAPTNQKYIISYQI